MKMIYTNKHRLFVGNMKHLLEAHGIEVILKNDYSLSGFPGVSVFDDWPELWIINDSDCDNANKIIEASLSKETEPEWICTKCGESNNASFGACWKCQTANS